MGSRITALTFNHDATKMASGSFDTDIIIWDMLAQRGLFRLRGHIKPITKIQFVQINDVRLSNKNNDNDVNNNNKLMVSDADNEMLISCSKDTSLKLWELETQHCVQTIVGHKNEVWSFDISKDEQFLVSGGLDSEVFVWKIEPRFVSDDNLSIESEEEDDDDDDDDDINMSVDHEKDSNASAKTVVSSISSIRIRALGTVDCGVIMGKKTRIVNIAYNEQSNLLFAQTNSSMIQLFYCRTDKELKKRLQIKKQKQKKKRELKKDAQS